MYKKFSELVKRGNGRLEGAIGWASVVSSGMYFIVLRDNSTQTGSNQWFIDTIEFVSTLLFLGGCILLLIGNFRMMITIDKYEDKSSELENKEDFD